MIVSGSGPHIVKYLQDRVESLKEKLDLAQARIDELERAFGSEDELAPLIMLGLSCSEAKIIHQLRIRGTVSKERLRCALYSSDPGNKAVAMHVSNARKKLEPLGVTIEAKRGSAADGYYSIPGPDKARLAKLIASGARLVVRGRPDRKHYRKAINTCEPQNTQV